MRPPLSAADLRALTQARASRPQDLLASIAARRRRSHLTHDGRLFIIAADHPARGALGAGGNPTAMADRHDLLQRLAVALEHCDGLLAAADLIEDLCYLGLLHDKVVIGTTNRGGILGASWELDDRLTAYDAEHARRLNLDGAKMLLRIAHDDPGTARTLELCARLVTELNDSQLLAMVEPLPYELVTLATGERRARLLKSEAQLLAAVTIASGLGASSAYTWLKLPMWNDPARMASATTLPVVLLGGEIETSLETTLAHWNEALHNPHRPLQGLVVGRSLLYPQYAASYERPHHASGEEGRSLLYPQTTASHADGSSPYADVAAAVIAARHLVHPIPGSKPPSASGAHP